MTAEQLRNSILQEAISGRLVPQDPNDEPAAALLARIREEKARLVKEGKLKKKDLVETPITEDEIPFEIPSSWIWVRYQNIADCALGKTKNPNQTDGELCPYLCSINVYWDSIRLNVLKEMLFSDTDKQKYSVENGDMLICEGGEAGRSAIYEGDVTPLYYQNALHRVRFYGHLCAKFYLYQMELYKKTGLLNEHIKGETIQHFVSTKLLNLPIPLPPLAEQKRIVAKLEELLPIVDQYGKAQKELDELNAALPARLRQSILQEAISGRLVPQNPNDEPAVALLQRIREEKARLVKEGKLKKKDLVETPITDEEKPFEIPSSWIWVRYQDIADCALGKTKNPNQTDGELCPYLCSINVYWDSVRLNVLKEMLFSDTDKQKYSVEKGDMLICEGGEAGRTAIYEGNISPLYYQNALHRVRFYGDICARFYLYQMELYKKTGLLTEHIKGETIQHFVSAKLLNLAIPLPPLAEQQRIVAKIEELLADINKISK